MLSVLYKNRVKPSDADADENRTAGHAVEEEIVTVGKSALKTLEPWKRFDLSETSFFLYIIKFIFLGLTLGLSTLRLTLLLLLTAFYGILAGISFLGTPKNSEFQDLTGWRRALMSTLPGLCKLFLFVVGGYSVKHNYITTEEMDALRAKYKIIANSNSGFDEIVEQAVAGPRILKQADDNSWAISISDPPTDKEPYIVVSNHISMLDPIVLITEFGMMSAVATADVLKYPLISTVAKQLQLLFVSRKTKSQLIPIMQKRSKDYLQLTDENKPLPPRLMVFPEGTTTNGYQLLQFHSGAFVGGHPVQPVMLRYPYKHYNNAWVESSFVASHVYQLLAQVFQQIEVTHFPYYYPTVQEKADPVLYTNNVRRLMCEGANMKIDQTQDVKNKKFVLSNVRFQRIAHTPDPLKS
jgi:1-acyl-sn-glycerol-3-phosphate acyltransferase